VNASGGMEFLSRSGIDTAFFLRTGELLAQTLWRKSNLATISSFQVKVLLEICYKRIITKKFIFTNLFLVFRCRELLQQGIQLGQYICH